MDNLDLLERLDDDVPIRRNLQHRTNMVNNFTEKEFKNRFRMSKIAFNEFCDLLEDVIEERKKAWAISRAEKILITLRFFASGSIQRVISDFHGINQSTFSKIITEVTDAICSLRINWIRRFDNLNTTKHNFYRFAGCPQIIGCIDGTHVKISERPREDNADDFLNRKGFYSINVQVVCDNNMRIIDIVSRWPGSVHDSRIFSNSTLYGELEANPNQGFILGDNGYPSKPYLLTPLLRPTTQAQINYNISHKRTRITVERCFGLLKRKFLCLQYGLRFGANKCCKVILATAILHNFIIEQDGLNYEEDDEDQFDVNPNDPVDQNVNQRQIGNHYRTIYINNHFA